MEVVAQLVRAPDCGSGGRGFESRLPPLINPKKIQSIFRLDFFVLYMFDYKCRSDAFTFLPLSIPTIKASLYPLSLTSCLSF